MEIKSNKFKNYKKLKENTVFRIKTFYRKMYFFKGNYILL